MIRAVGARSAVAALVAGIAATMLPASAAGWGFADRCYVAMRNETNVTFNTNNFDGLIVAIPDFWHGTHRADPSRDDVPPGKMSMLFSAGGFPYCEIDIGWNTPDHGSVSCLIQGLTWAANEFQCEAAPDHGRIPSFKIVDRLDNFGNIGGTVEIRGFASGGAFGSTPPPRLKPGPAPLRAGDLPGRDWHRPSRTETLRLVASLRPTSSALGCSNRKPAPSEASSTASWLFVRDHQGSELVTGTALRFASPAQTRRAQAASLSPAVVRCFARGIRARRGLAASAQPLSFGRVGDGSSAYRIRIRAASSNGRAYLDLVSLLKGRSMAVIAFYAEDHPIATGVEHAAAATLARRIRR